MVQLLDIRYQDEVESKPLNHRFLDISKPSVFRGFRLTKGTGPFDVTLSRATKHNSAAVTPSGVKVTETDDVIDAVTVAPNPANEYRTDCVFLKYEYGRYDAVASYVVAQGIGTAEPVNPNPATHLLLGWVSVPPRNAPLTNESFRDVPKGVKIPEMIGDTIFDGDFTITGDITIGGEVIGSLGQDIQGTFIEKMPRPVIVEAGQEEFETHKPYIMNSNSLFVYINDRLTMPSEILEMGPKTFRFVTPPKKGDVVWAYWFLKLELIKVEEHDHDDRYYTKEEIDKRMVIYDRGKFTGMTGTVIQHDFGGLDYSVVGIVPTQKADNVGFISVAKGDNQINVYNSGSYRGTFDIAYILNNDDDSFPHGVGNIYRVVAEEQDTVTKTYKKVKRYRKNATLHSESVLMNPDPRGLYTQLVMIFYDYKGTTEVARRSYNLAFDADGRLAGSERTE